MSWLVNTAKSVLGFGGQSSSMQHGMDEGKHDTLHFPVEPGHEGKELVVVPARFYVLNRYRPDQFDLVDGDAVASVVSTEEPYRYMLVIRDSQDAVILAQRIASDLNMGFDVRDKAIRWTAEADDVVIVLSLLVERDKELQMLKEKILVALWETSQQQDSGKANMDQDWASGTFELRTRELSHYEPDPSEDMDYEVEQGAEEEEEEDTARRGYRTPVQPRIRRSNASAERQREFLGDRARNSALSVGMANNRTFVFRGSRIGVFKHDRDDNLEYVSQIPVVETLEGEVFSPSKAMLHEHDRKLLLLNPEKDNRVFCMDLERGEVVEEWHTAFDEMKIRDVAPLEKYAQRTDEKLVVAVNNATMFTLDPRNSGQNKIGRQFRGYKTNPHMSCIFTTGEGYIVTGSDKGELRLFDDIEKQAKTMFPGLGDPIIGLDVTENGKWVLATTEKYLIVVNTEKKDGRTGFEAKMSADEKPVPIKLQLLPADLARFQIRRVKFTPAHFDIGERIDEKWIVTSVGPYVVTWNFRKVKHGNVTDYRIARMPDSVVADQFRFDREDIIVTACPDDVMDVRRVQGAHH